MNIFFNSSSPLIHPREAEKARGLILSIALFALSVFALTIVKRFHLPSPKKVESIYTVRTKGQLRSADEKVKELRQKSNVLGICFVPHAQNPEQAIPIYLTRNFAHFCDTGFLRAYELKTDALVGELVYDTLSHQINITSLDSYAENRIKNVGFSLIKSLIQLYKENRSAHFTLSASGNSPPFYHKLGFRLSDPEDLHRQAEIASLADSSQRTFENKGILAMHLPKEAYHLWVDEVDKNPIPFF